MSRRRRGLGPALAIGVPLAILALVGLASSDAAGSSSGGEATLWVGGIAWPLPDWPPGTVQEWRSGARTFGAARPKKGNIDEHVHAGVDLGPPKLDGVTSRAYGARVLAPVAGVVEVVDGGWDGPEARRIEIVSPEHGRIVLGAVQPDAAVAKGDEVTAGQLVGWVGRYPGGSTMLHIEQHDGIRRRWKVGSPQPKSILDPRDGVLAPYLSYVPVS